MINTKFYGYSRLQVTWHSTNRVCSCLLRCLDFRVPKNHWASERRANRWEQIHGLLCTQKAFEYASQSPLLTDRGGKCYSHSHCECSKNGLRTTPTRISLVLDKYCIRWHRELQLGRSACKCPDSPHAENVASHALAQSGARRASYLVLWKHCRRIVSSPRYDLARQCRRPDGFRPWLRASEFDWHAKY